ncbi:hypothetical protein [Archaeoglobus neptunius]|uniref:hypothetical protein n=1 Tax=Archaeoglobus neptunius TaxID=2798580 RepID=UPI00192740DC|nr:hypothetical protein [Archaeoglobus neptunius]
MIGISWQILLAVVSVIAGFVVTDKFLERKGFRVKKRGVHVTLENLARHLAERYLVKVAVITEDLHEVVDVDEYEVDEMRTALEVSRSDEILLIAGSDYRYAVKRGNAFVYVHGKFISLEDFSKLWLTVQNAFEGVKS